MRPYQVNHENEDPDIKKIKKVLPSTHFFGVFVVFWRLTWGFLHSVCALVSQAAVARPSSGAELHAGLALSEEVEDHRSGLHLLSSR